LYIVKKSVTVGVLNKIISFIKTQLSLFSLFMVGVITHGFVTVKNAHM